MAYVSACTSYLTHECKYMNSYHSSLPLKKEAVSVMSEYPQDGGSVCCCYDYRVDAGLQNCMERCIFRVIWCSMTNACHAEREYPQDVSEGKFIHSNLISCSLIGSLVNTWMYWKCPLHSVYCAQSASRLRKVLLVRDRVHERHTAWSIFFTG